MLLNEQVISSFLQYSINPSLLPGIPWATSQGPNSLDACMTLPHASTLIFPLFHGRCFTSWEYFKKIKEKNLPPGIQFYALIYAQDPFDDFLHSIEQLHLVGFFSRETSCYAVISEPNRKSHDDYFGSFLQVPKGMCYHHSCQPVSYTCMFCKLETFMFQDFHNEIFDVENSAGW